MKLRRIFGSSLSLVLLVTGVGCGNSNTPPAGSAGTAATSAAVATPVPVASEAKRGDHGDHGGKGDGKGPGRGGRRGMRGGGSIAARIIDEADDLDLTDDQKAAIEKIQKDARPEGGPAKSDWKDVQAELVAGVKAGKIDTAKIDAKSAALDKAMEAAHAKEAESLNALHATLKPEQRKAVVAAVKAQADKREERADKRAEEKKTDEKKDDKKDEKKAKSDERAKKKLERLTKQLELDAAQQKKVEAILAKDKEEPPTAAAIDAAREESKKKNDAVLAAFEAEAFDAKKLDLTGGGGAGPAAGKKGKSGINSEVAFLVQLLPVLKPEQREKLAASMDKPWGMGRMGDRSGGHRFGFFDESPMMPPGMMRAPFGGPAAPAAPAGKDLVRRHPDSPMLPNGENAVISLEMTAFLRYEPRVIRLDNIGKRHGKQILFVEASAAVNRGDKVGLVGPNGAGKSTIFRMIVKEDAPDEGQVAVDKGVTIGYFSQDVGEMKGQSVVAETMDGAGEVADVAREMRELEHALGDPDRADEMDKLIDRFGHVQARFEELGGYALEADAREILAGLGFSQEVMDGDVGNLSGGWKMRVALARILLMKPDALLLDEPTNHLDIESILWLEAFLRGYEGGLIMTSHDRAFLNRLVNKIIDIDSGDLVTYTGDYDWYEQQRLLSEAQAEAQYARQQAMLAKEERFIERFKTHAAKASQVQSRVKKLDKIEKVEPPKKRSHLRFDFPESPRSGEDVANLRNVKKGYGTRVIYDDFSMLIRRRERWCVMGVNGAGKSTLLKLIAGESKADSGEVAVGGSVKMGYFSQHAMDVLTPTDSVWDTLVKAFPRASIGSLRTLAGVFGFSGDDIEKPVRILSGGEKARVVLARMLYDPPNFLVLDEPTNHLDMVTKEMLVAALAGYEGTMIFVSHDRHFLAALSNRVLEITPEGPKVYGGGYLEYVATSGHEAPGLRT